MGLALEIFPSSVSTLRRESSDRVYESEASLTVSGVAYAVLNSRERHKFLKLSRDLRVAKLFRSQAVYATDTHIRCRQSDDEIESDILRATRALAHAKE